ncbi:hypothetical protein LTR93_011205 [Exophiala xenobiotica]|nr:hypothetical protein LTR93_011205 [Exophiala xenobiotica]
MRKTIHFLEAIKEPRLEDYIINYQYQNRFASLGNGAFKARERTEVHGLAT